MLLGDQVYADDDLADGQAAAQAAPAAAEEAPADQVVELRRVHQALPGVLARPGDPLAALHRAERDDLRRPRGDRRLEHLGGLAGATCAQQAWWAERIRSGLASYWVYQHLGNLSPDEIADDPLYAKVVAAEDATDVLREFGERVDPEADEAHDTERWRAVQYQWSYAARSGPDPPGHAGQPVQPGARTGRAGRCWRAGEWSWFLDRAHGVYDHLVVGTSLPWLLPPGIHHVEAWNERLADSRRPWVAGARRADAPGLDLEHWAAFRRSFDALGALFARIGSGAQGTTGDRIGAGPAYPPPASISVLSGDVHHSYVARARFDDPGVRTPVHQLTCSPMHNQVPAAMRLLTKLGWSPGPAAAARALARSAGVRPPDRGLEEAGRAVLRQCGRHAGPHRAGRRGRDRGHHQRRSPARGGPAATRLGEVSERHVRSVRVDEHLPETLRVVEHELAALLRRGRALSLEIAREVHPNLEPNAYGLLLWLRRSGSTRLTDLAVLLGIGKGTLSRQIHGLETLGLVRRDPDPADRRAAQLRLTEEGSRRFDAARSARMVRSPDPWRRGRNGTSRSSPASYTGSTRPSDPVTPRPLAPAPGQGE